MRGDIPAAAFRLLTQLPIRTHEAAFQEKKRKQFRLRPEGQKILDGRGRKKRVRVWGREFDSQIQASERLKISIPRIRRMIKRGEAQYVD